MALLWVLIGATAFAFVFGRILVFCLGSPQETIHERAARERAVQSNIQYNSYPAAGLPLHSTNTTYSSAGFLPSTNNGSSSRTWWGSRTATVPMSDGGSYVPPVVPHHSQYSTGGSNGSSSTYLTTSSGYGSGSGSPRSVYGQPPPASPFAPPPPPTNTPLYHAGSTYVSAHSPASTPPASPSAPSTLHSVAVANDDLPSYSEATRSHETYTIIQRKQQSRSARVIPDKEQMRGETSKNLDRITFFDMGDPSPEIILPLLKRSVSAPIPTANHERYRRPSRMIRANTTPSSALSGAGEPGPPRTISGVKRNRQLSPQKIVHVDDKVRREEDDDDDVLIVRRVKKPRQLGSAAAPISLESPLEGAVLPQPGLMMPRRPAATRTTTTTTTTTATAAAAAPIAAGTGSQGGGGVGQARPTYPPPPPQPWAGSRGIWSGGGGIGPSDTTTDVLELLHGNCPGKGKYCFAVNGTRCEVETVLAGGMVVDMTWFRTLFPATKMPQVTVVVHKDTDGVRPRAMVSNNARGEMTIVPKRGKWGNFHAKFFIVKTPTKTRVSIFSANLSAEDWDSLAQCGWTGDFNNCEQGRESNSGFGGHLRMFLGECGIPSGKFEWLNKVDWAPAVGVHLLATCPRSSRPVEGMMPSIRTKRMEGLRGMEEIVGKLELEPVDADTELHVTVQCTSFGNLGNRGWITKFVNLMLGRRQPAKSNTLRLLYPSKTKFVANNRQNVNFGQAAGPKLWLQDTHAATPGFPINSFYETDLDPAKGFPPALMSHSKYVIVSRRQGGTDRLEFVYVGSANLSPSAWGSPPTDHNFYSSNYELGVVIAPDFDGQAQAMERALVMSWPCRNRHNDPVKRSQIEAALAPRRRPGFVIHQGGGAHYLDFLGALGYFGGDDDYFW